MQKGKIKSLVAAAMEVSEMFVQERYNKKNELIGLGVGINGLYPEKAVSIALTKKMDCEEAQERILSLWTECQEVDLDELLSDEATIPEEKEQKVPDKLALEDVEEAIVGEQYTTATDKTTVGVFTLRNGFEIVTSSSCVDPANYDVKIGMNLCKKKAIEKVWELEGYLLQQKHFEAAAEDVA